MKKSGSSYNLFTKEEMERIRELKEFMYGIIVPHDDRRPLDASIIAKIEKELENED